MTTTEADLAAQPPVDHPNEHAAPRVLNRTEPESSGRRRQLGTWSGVGSSCLRRCRPAGGADLLVVPSMLKPCGLAPLIGLRYGTMPVVRAVAGIVDTLFDHDYSVRLPVYHTLMSNPGMLYQEVYRKLNSKK